MAVSINRGPQYRPPYTITLLIATPEMIPQVFGNFISAFCCQKESCVTLSAPPARVDMRDLGSRGLGFKA